MIFLFIFALVCLKEILGKPNQRVKLYSLYPCTFNLKLPINTKINSFQR